MSRRVGEKIYLTRIEAAKGFAQEVIKDRGRFHKERGESVKLIFKQLIGDPDWIRTNDLQLRRT